jgi:hypothetical protein
MDKLLCLHSKSSWSSTEYHRSPPPLNAGCHREELHWLTRHRPAEESQGAMFSICHHANVWPVPLPKLNAALSQANVAAAWKKLTVLAKRVTEMKHAARCQGGLLPGPRRRGPMLGGCWLALAQLTNKATMKVRFCSQPHFPRTLQTRIVQAGVLIVGTFKLQGHWDYTGRLIGPSDELCHLRN